MVSGRTKRKRYRVTPKDKKITKLPITKLNIFKDKINSNNELSSEETKFYQKCLLVSILNKNKDDIKFLLDLTENNKYRDVLFNFRLEEIIDGTSDINPTALIFPKGSTFIMMMTIADIDNDFNDAQTFSEDLNNNILINLLSNLQSYPLEYQVDYFMVKNEFDYNIIDYAKQYKSNILFGYGMELYNAVQDWGTDELKNKVHDSGIEMWKKPEPIPIPSIDVSIARTMFQGKSEDEMLENMFQQFKKIPDDGDDVNMNAMATYIPMLLELDPSFSEVFKKVIPYIERLPSSPKKEKLLKIFKVE